MLVEKFRLLKSNPTIYYHGGDFYVKVPTEENLSVCSYISNRTFYIKVVDRMTNKWELYATVESTVWIEDRIKKECDAYTNSKNCEMAFETKLIKQSTIGNQQEIENV